MINAVDNRPNYKQTVTCLNCPHCKDIARYNQALICNKHDSWTVEPNFVCDDHPQLLRAVGATGPAGETVGKLRADGSITSLTVEELHDEKMRKVDGLPPEDLAKDIRMNHLTKEAQGIDEKAFLKSAKERIRFSSSKKFIAKAKVNEMEGKIDVTITVRRKTTAKRKK